jgi:hypothetical protein
MVEQQAHAGPPSNLGAPHAAIIAQIEREGGQRGPAR